MANNAVHALSGTAPAAHLLAELDLQLKSEPKYSPALRLPATLCVYGRRSPYFPGNREMPEEPAGYDIERITLQIGACAMDITNECNQVLLDWIDRILEDA